MDNYIERSVKEGTRQNRAGDPGPRTYITGFHQKMPQGQRWLQLLNNGDNKNELISLFVKFLISPERRRELKIPFTITEGEKTWKINEADFESSFLCNHEEADSRIVLHASQSTKNVVVVAKDTDVLVILVYAYLRVSPVNSWVMRYDSSKFANIGTIAGFLGHEICSNIIK